MSTLSAKLAALEAQERALDETLQTLSLQHYRALTGAGAASVSVLPEGAAGSARAACAELAGCPADDLSVLQQRVAHLRAAASSSGVAGAGGAGSSAGVAALDLLELPALMDTCVRGALAARPTGAAPAAAGSLTAGDDAVDLVEMACDLFASQGLLSAAAESLKGGSGSGAESPAPTAAQHAVLLASIVREVVWHAVELQGGLETALGSRAPLPVVLKAVALLRRLARLQRHALARSIASAASAGTATSSLPPTVTASAEAATTAEISAWLRWLFLAERDALIAREVEAAASEGPPVVEGSAASKALLAGQQQPALLRVLEHHRTLCAELVSQFSAVTSSLSGRAAPGTATPTAAQSQQAAATSATGDALARSALAEALSWRCGAMLHGACEALIRLPDGALASAAQPLSYAARRSARFGIDYSAPLATAWTAQLLDAVSTRLLAARRTLLAADVLNERACAALVNAALRATLDVFNAVRNVLPAAHKGDILGEFVSHLHALADAPAVTSWPVCAGAFSEAAEGLFGALERLAAVL